MANKRSFEGKSLKAKEEKSEDTMENERSFEGKVLKVKERNCKGEVAEVKKRS